MKMEGDRGFESGIDVNHRDCVKEGQIEVGKRGNKLV